MDDAAKVLTAKFSVSASVLKKISDESPEVNSWLTVLGAYILDNDKKQEEQRDNEALLRKQRLNAEHQLGQLEKQLISCNVQVSKYEKDINEVRQERTQKEIALEEAEKKLREANDNNKSITEENEKLNQKNQSFENEKSDFSSMLEKKNSEIERLNEEWQEMSKKLNEANKLRYEMQYKMEEIKNSDIRKEFREKRLEQEKSMLTQQLENANTELRIKTDTLNDLQKEKSASFLDLQAKYDILHHEHFQTETNFEASKKKCEMQEGKIEGLMAKLKSMAEENTEAVNNMQQELSAQTKLVSLYKDDRDHAKEKLEEVTGAVNEFQVLVKDLSEEKMKVEAKLQAEQEESSRKIEEMETKLKQQSTELVNANELLQVSRKSGSKIVSEAELANLSPLAAATSAILKKGMSLTQIYTEYVKTSDELMLEKDENARLKLYMEQILQEVEEKAPLLMRQKQDYEHGRRTIETMAQKLEDNIKECQKLQNLTSEYERKVDFHKREEKRLHSLCVDLSQQVRILLKEVEEARGGHVSSSNTLPELLSNADESNTSCGQVISEHLVTFKSIEELQSQNQRLLLTVRELSEEQEKLEQEGGPEIIQELKKKIENAQSDLETLRENNKTQDEIMQQLKRQRDMYKVLCQQGGVMVGEVSSTSAVGSQSVIEVEGELSKSKAELTSSQIEMKKLKDEIASKERKWSEKNNKQLEQIAASKVECDTLKNKVEYVEEKYSILQTTSDGYKKEAKALEDKCKSITDALSKARVESEKYKQDYNEAKEKLISAEVNVKSLQVEKNLIKEAEKRIMQENQSLLDQQRSQNVLLNNLQSIQNNLERQEFQTRNSLGKQVESLQREIKALRRQSVNEAQQFKTAGTVLEKDVKDLQIKIGIEQEKKKQFQEELESSKKVVDQLESKCKELELQNKATEERLDSVLMREASGKAKEDYQREMERYKTKVRELELAVGNATSGKKAAEDQLEVTRNHLEQYKEICASSEVALSKVTKEKDDQLKNSEEKMKEAEDTIKRLRTEMAQHINEKGNIKRSSEEAERAHQYTISELKGQMAPLERRFQEVTRALVNAKEVETEAVKEKQLQVKLAKEAQDKYEKEIVHHGKDVEILTQLKEELKELKSRYGGIEEREAQMNTRLEMNEKLMDQMKDHHIQEIRKGESTRKDLIDQNAILHGQVEKLSAQLAASKMQTRAEDKEESFADKSVEEVYELLRFVRREKEIAETKAEASETESMRYRQRAEHLQRDLDETKVALDLELERTKGHMLTTQEHSDLLEKIKKSKEFEEMNNHYVKEKELLDKKLKEILEKNKKLEEDLKPLQLAKKTLEGEKSSWLAEKTALKQEIERWTHRTNQLMAQGTKGENEEIKKLQSTKVHSEKAIAGLQDEIRRTKQQLEGLKRESLKLKSENNELQSKVTSLQNANKSAGANASAAELEMQVAGLQKTNEEMKKSHEHDMAELAEKNKTIQQLKRLAKKYKVQSDKQQKMLKDGNGETSTTPGSTAAAAETPPSVDLITPVKAMTQVASLTDDEKVRMEGQLSQITTELTDLQALYNEEKAKNSSFEKKYEELQKEYQDSENKINDLKASLDSLQAECNEKEKEKEKNRKLLKTAKDKISTLTKNKDSNNREMEILRNKVYDMQKAMEQSKTSTIEQANSFNAVRVQLDVKIINLEKQLKESHAEKRSLLENVEELQKLLEQRLLSDQKMKVTGKVGKPSGKQKSRIQAMTRGTLKSAKGDSMPGSDVSSHTLLTAKVRPSATPASQATSKFHPQSTRTASVRPLSHSAPTAMISPTVPVTQTGTAPTLVASVAALPVTASVTPQIAQGQISQGRQLTDRSLLSFKTPVARVQVQARDEEQLDDEQIMGQQPGPSSSSDQVVGFGKRSHLEIADDDDEDDIALLEDIEPDQPKRQRVENLEEDQLMADSQDGQLEEELLAEEEGDDDVIDDPQQFTDEISSQAIVGSREAQLQMERSLQPSPQEILRQSRMQGRARNQLPSFSLPGQSSGFYEETDDSTVPSTPVLFMPKRTDGFAEALSSPGLRHPTFSFPTEQAAGIVQSSTLEHSGNLHETRVDLMNSEDQANVPQTSLSVVPVSNVDHRDSRMALIQDAVQRDERRAVYGGQYFAEDNGQEQNVPQQIDLTEDDDDEDDDLPQGVIEEGIAEDGDEGISAMAGDGDLDDDVDSEDTETDDEIDSESDDSDASEKLGNDPRNMELLDNRNDIVEIDIPDEEKFGEEEESHAEQVPPEEKAAGSMPDYQVESFGDDAGNLDIPQANPVTSEEQDASTSNVPEIERAKPVRITRTSRGGVRPRIHRQPTSTLRGRFKKSLEKTKK